jgi:hypothetical protein
MTTTEEPRNEAHMRNLSSDDVLVDAVDASVLPERLALLDVDDPDDDRGSHSNPSLFNSLIRNGVIVDGFPSCISLYCLPIHSGKKEHRKFV